MAPDSQDTRSAPRFVVADGGGRVSKQKASKSTLHGRRTASRSSVLLGEEMERDRASGRGGGPSSSPSFRFDPLKESPFNESQFKVVSSSPVSMRTIPQMSELRTPSRRARPSIMIREKTASERNLITPPVSASQASKQFPPSFTPSFKAQSSTPTFKIRQGTPTSSYQPQLGTPTFKLVDVKKEDVSPHNEELGFPSTPQSIKFRGGLEHTTLNQPVFSPFSSSATPSKSSANFNLARLSTQDSTEPIIHPFWSPSPKKVWSYLITGGISDFLHSAVANVEDLMELQKNSSVYFSGAGVGVGAGGPFNNTHEGKLVKVLSCLRWNRFTWKADLASPVTDNDESLTVKVILILPHDKPQANIELKEGMEVKLGPVYQELEGSKVYLKWHVVEATNEA